MTWQKIEDNVWWFGEPIRGIIRKPLAVVQLGRIQYEWHIEKSFGYATSFIKAMEAAEKALGIQN